MSTVTTDLHLAIAQAPVLDQLLRDGARRMLQHAIEREVDEYLDAHDHARANVAGGWWCAMVTCRRATCRRRSSRCASSSRGWMIVAATNRAMSSSRAIYAGVK